MCNLKIASGNLYRTKMHRIRRKKPIKKRVREERDLRSSGPLFCLTADEIADISFAAAFEKLQLFLQKLLEGFITRKEEICALVTDFLAGLPADMKRFLDFKGLMGTSTPETGCEV